MLEQKTTIELQGSSIINGESRIEGGANFHGVDPATGARLEPVYRCASIEDLNVAADLADEAFAVYRKLAGKERARFLRHVADGIEAIVPELVERAHRETALPEARLKGESARTINQLRLFAQVVEDGSWVNARIDPAQPDRKPLPRSDIRSMMKPLGPVAVFGASNFPLAFSVAGGDTAAAFAAGCPVIVKAHHAHPGTSEMVGQVIARSVKECGLPAGVFALLFGAGSEIGAALVDHPKVKAVGFTGSLGAGRALMQRAAARPEPIPCFMEMSSVNPVFVLPEALHKRGGQIAGGLFGSFTLGVGQFCTKPGLVYLPRNADADGLIAELKAQTERGAASPMLTGGIAKSYHSGIAGRQAQGGVETVAQAGKDGAGDTYAAPVVMQVSAGELLGDPELATEVFGPTTLVIRYDSREELMTLAESLEGQLTSTLHGSDADLEAYADLIAVLERKAGRLIVNGFPTGVEVCHAMVHGGPYPATSDSRATSVGTYSIYRFVRPVCYQDFPQAALPDELIDGNPLRIWRLVDGQFTRDAVGSAAKAGKE
ncbi:MAG: aldehyde dehydrogenase (NADP(+)) [Terracidiphilus sp.]|jgi:NADP-dependent aldehyde dehydrogenase